MQPAYEPLLCIDCHLPLVLGDGAHDIVRCECGLAYSVDLLLCADRQVWEYVREQRCFRRDGTTVWFDRSDLPGDLVRPGPPPSHRDELQMAYNALCSAEASLDKANAGDTIRGRLAEIRFELGRTAFPRTVDNPEDATAHSDHDRGDER